MSFIRNKAGHLIAIRAVTDSLSTGKSGKGIDFKKLLFLRSIMIREIARGHIILETQEGVVRILGEALLSGYGSRDFVVYENSIKEWLEPEKEVISPSSKRNILEQLKKDVKEKQLKIEIV